MEVHFFFGYQSHHLFGIKRMSSTQLELIRQNHELVERLELAIGEELDHKPSGVSSFFLLFVSAFEGNACITNSLPHATFIAAKAKGLATAQAEGND